MFDNGRLQRGILRARRERRTIVEPTRRDIQIDLDSVNAMRIFARQLAMLDAHGLTVGWSFEIAPSRTRGHAHVMIRLPRSAPLRTRVLLAALLGSDLKREAFNYIRVVRRRRLPVVFFETVIAADKFRRRGRLAKLKDVHDMVDALFLVARRLQ